MVSPNPPHGRLRTRHTLRKSYENNQAGSFPTLSSPSSRPAPLPSLGSYHTMCPSTNRTLLVATCLLEAKIVFQSQRNLDPTLWHTIILIRIFVLVVRVLPYSILRILVELLDIIKRSTSVSAECLGSHGPNTIDACKLPHGLVPFVFENGFCEVFVEPEKVALFRTLTGFPDLTILEVLPDLS